MCVNYVLAVMKPGGNVPMKRIQKSLAFSVQLCQCSEKNYSFRRFKSEGYGFEWNYAGVYISVLISFRPSDQKERRRRLQKSNHKVRCVLLFEMTQTSSLKTVFEV